MVSLNPNPLKGFVLSPMGMSLPNIGSFPTATATATAAAAPPLTILSSDDQAKKVRKPYTITKSGESWTEPEHDKFLEALQLFDRDWGKIEVFVGSKTVIQIHSHAQKFFLKVQKNGTNEHLPPPQPTDDDYWVHDSMPLYDVLNQFQKEHTHVAVVLKRESNLMDTAQNVVTVDIYSNLTPKIADERVRICISLDAHLLWLLKLRLSKFSFK